MIISLLSRDVGWDLREEGAIIGPLHANEYYTVYFHPRGEIQEVDVCRGWGDIVVDALQAAGYDVRLQGEAAEYDVRLEEVDIDA